MINSEHSKSRGIKLRSSKSVLYKLTGKIGVSGQKLKAFPLRSKSRQGCHLLLCSSIQYLKFRCNKQARKEIWYIKTQNEQKRMKKTRDNQFADNMFLYL